MASLDLGDGPQKLSAYLAEDTYTPEAVEFLTKCFDRKCADQNRIRTTDLIEVGRVEFQGMRVVKIEAETAMREGPAL